MAKKEIIYKDNRFDISYEIINFNKSNTIIFLHGWGSNKEVMKIAFGKLFKDFKHIYIDMPGFGDSLNNIILTTKDYANIIDIFLQSINIKKEIIFGHSFGGKVATLLNPDILVLLSSAGIVEKKPLFIRFKIKLFKVLKNIGLGRFYHLFASSDVDGMSKNMYETFKNVVDEDFSKNFKNFKNKSYIFWGIDDKAVSLDSGKKINNLITNSKFYPLKGDHYFFLDRAKEIEKILILYLKE